MADRPIHRPQHGTNEMMGQEQTVDGRDASAHAYNIGHSGVLATLRDNTRLGCRDFQGPPIPPIPVYEAATTYGAGRPQRAQATKNDDGRSRHPRRGHDARGFHRVGLKAGRRDHTSSDPPSRTIEDPGGAYKGIRKVTRRPPRPSGTPMFRTRLPRRNPRPCTSPVNERTPDASR